jgi:hypothetical protein
MAANMTASTELKYKWSYISKVYVESYVLQVPEFNGETKNGIKIS